MIQRAPTYHRSVIIEINYSSVLHLKYEIILTHQKMSTKRQGQLDDWLSAKQRKKTKGSKGKYLVGVKGYFAEIAEESSYGELEVYVDGVEFIYST